MDHGAFSMPCGAGSVNPADVTPKADGPCSSLHRNCFVLSVVVALLT